MEPLLPERTAGLDVAGVGIPDLFVGGRWIAGDDVEAVARAWHAAIAEAVPDDARAIGAVVPSSAEGLILFVAATSLPLPVVLLEPDPQAWQSDPPMPAGTLIVLPPGLAHLSNAVTGRGHVPLAIPEGLPSRAARPLALLSSPQIITFTSGSTGSPKPVVRRVTSMLGYATTRLSVLGIRRGEGIIAGTSLAHGNGLTRFLSAMALGGPFALLNPRDHRAALSTLARTEFHFWGATAHFVDVLSRCVIAGPAIAPRVCLVTSPIAEPVYHAFRDRFGVPLRQNYSSSETGALAVDGAPEHDVRRETVGRPLPGISIRIGDQPDRAVSQGTVGRIWAKTPWLMDGYGFPPDLDRPGMVDGWWPTRDLGVMMAGGHLQLAGRLDDCIRTREGQLVNLHAVASGLRALAGVRAAEVVPIAAPAGSSFGALLECDPGVDLSTIRRRVADALPAWSWPRRLEVVSSLPRLSNGKVDRRACRAALGIEDAP